MRGIEPASSSTRRDVVEPSAGRELGDDLAIGCSRRRRSTGALRHVPDRREPDRRDRRRRIGDDDPGDERRERLVGAQRDLEGIDAGRADVERGLAGRTREAERDEHRSLLVAVELLQVERIRLVDAVAEPLAVDGAVERVAARDRLMDAQAQRDRFVLGEQRGRDVEPQQDVAAEVHPRRLLVEQRELRDRRRSRGGARGEHRTEARREQHERDQERARRRTRFTAFVRARTSRRATAGTRPVRRARTRGRCRTAC